MKLCMKASTRKSVVVVVVVFSPDFPVQTFLFVCWFCLFVLFCCLLLFSILLFVMGYVTSI